MIGRPFAGPDERHTISKMTTTKVECQELSSEGPQVEEIASYSYTIQEENSQKAQNGVLVEEVSESDDNKAKLIVNRGVSIVSVSDDESTLKGISRDVSADDIHNADLWESQKLMNGSYEEVVIPKTFEERTFDDLKPQRAVRFTDTIAEELSLEESLLEKQPKLVELPQSQIPVVEESKLSRQSSKLERLNSAEPIVPVKRELSQETSQKGTRLDDEEIDEEMEALLKRVKQQRSVLGDILDKEGERRKSGKVRIFKRPLVGNS